MCETVGEKEGNREREVGSLELCGRLQCICVCVYKVKRETNKGGNIQKGDM